MIVYKTWTTMQYKNRFNRYKWHGWFLFGIIPLYLKRETIQ